ncbi:MAG: carboxypeptidase regulatory-like domain-containing protein [Vicinamibacterales bacterium]
MKRWTTIFCWALLVSLASVASVRAQSATTGAIAGVARDTTGAVLPGVTVEAASPALIEKVRVAVTDATGNYKIIDLRPGTYTVTFTLPGFATYKREGLELSTGFTATANAEMRVGGLEETVTVTGASPVVDVQNSRVQEVLRADVLDALPTGSKSVMAFTNSVLGAAPSSPGAMDVGGDKGESATGISLHGSRGDDGKVNLDGMNINNFNGSGGGRMRVYYPNMVAAQEVVIDTGGNVAESETGGANQNIVPREGSNNFSLYGIANYTNDSLSTTSLSDEVKARGAREISTVKVIFDYGIGVGGPIKQDKLWFYATNRWWGSQSPAPANWFNKSTNPFVYDPDLDRPAYGDQYYRDTSVRLTLQASGKDKFALEQHLQHGCSCWLAIGRGALSSPEATTHFLYGPQWLTQLSWTRAQTNKLLLQASSSFIWQGVAFTGTSEETRNRFTFVSPLPTVPNAVNVSELTNGRSWGALGPGGNSYGPMNPNNNFNQRVAVSYVTGSHAFKVGVQTLQGMQDTIGPSAQDLAQFPGRNIGFALQAGRPVRLTQTAGPLYSAVRVRSFGIFAQDQWTVGKLTLNYGGRYDQFRGYAPAIDLPAGPYLGAISLPKLDGIPDYKDVTLRVGGAYDMFGNGKTAIKGSFGRYLLGQGGGIAAAYAPAAAIQRTTTRTWNDANGNFVPDCDLSNFGNNGECAAISNNAFGTPVVNTRLDDSAREGWNVRGYNWQGTIGLQHELRPGLGLSVGYFRTWWRNHTVTENTRVTPADFTEYCITTPSDDRLGDFSASRVCGLYDVNPNRFGQVTSVVKLAKDFGLGLPEERYDGVDINVNGRWGQGAFASGGVSFGRQVLDFCYANGHPELTPMGFPANYPRAESHCNNKNAWWTGTQIKGQAAYPLPLGFQLSGTFRHMPGVPQSANLVMTNAQVAATLGRNLSACTAAGTCTATQTVSILPSAQGGDDGARAAAQFDQRLTNIDLRATKTFRFGGRRRIQAIFDVYNVFNNRPIQGINATYGAVWLNATSVLTGRLFKFGTQIDW